MSLSKPMAPPPTEELGPGGLNPEFKFANDVGRFHWQACNKTPGHQPFIPVKDFKKEDLPFKYQDYKVWQSIMLMSELTVRVLARYTSKDRQVGDSTYPMRGKTCVRNGSGMVSSIQQCDTQELCPCQECEHSSQKQTFFARVFVKTANHVVYDDSEVKETVAELFYDDERDCDNVRRLFGSRLVRRNLREDWSEFECLTHDFELMDRLKKSLQKYEELSRHLERKVFDPDLCLAVVASHPHGRSKHISVGELRQLDSKKTSGGFKPILIPRQNPDIVADGESVTITYDFNHPPSSYSHGMVANHTSDSDSLEECEPTAIEVGVLFPDDTTAQVLIWQLDRPVVDTKKWLLQYGGIKNPSPKKLAMEILLPDGDTQLMNDDENINYYWDDICRAENIHFIEKCEEPQVESVMIKTAIVDKHYADLDKTVKQVIPNNTSRTQMMSCM